MRNVLSHEKFLYQAISTNTLRGKDSTGMYMVPHDDDREVAIYKKPIPGYDFVDTRGYDTMTSDLEDFKFIIGHNRAKTVGRATAANAHPFSIGGITLVHNGTIHNPQSLYTGSGYFTVDSEALCYAISRHGAEEVLPKIQGAYAIIWHDASTNDIYMARNSERPLHFATTKSKKAIYISSELSHLDWITERIANINIDKYYELDEDIILRFKSDAVHEPETIAKVPKAATRLITYDNRNKGSNAFNNSGVDIKPEVLLKQYGLNMKDKIKFKPVSYAGYSAGSASGTMRGVSLIRNVGVVLCGVPGAKSKKLLNLASNKTVQGVINHARVNDGGGIIVTVQFNSIKIKKFTEKEEKDTDEALVDGPNHTKISVSAFNKLVAMGCEWCHDPVEHGDAETIIFIPQEQGGGILCGECCRLTGAKTEGNMLEDIPAPLNL